MGRDRASDMKPISRPRKSGADRARRINVHRKRLTDAGVSGESVRRMDHKQLRAKLAEIRKG